MGCLQIFSDKSQSDRSQISLSACSLELYTLHVTLFNIDEKRSRQLIVKGNTIFAFLPIFMQVEKTFASADEDLGNKNEKITKVMSLETLHELIEFSMIPLLDAAVRGMASTSIDGKKYLVHLLLTSYFADLTETEDLLELKRGL